MKIKRGKRLAAFYNFFNEFLFCFLIQIKTKIFDLSSIGYDSFYDFIKFIIITNIFVENCINKQQMCYKVQ